MLGTLYYVLRFEVVQIPKIMSVAGGGGVAGETYVLLPVMWCPKVELDTTLEISW